MNVYESAMKRLDDVARIMNLSDKEVRIFKKPAQLKKATLEIDGEKIPAWRIVYNRALGPGKGGIRFHPEVSEDEVKSLSFWMALKNSLAGLPYGGGKGGVKFDPKKKDKKYIEKVARAYIDAFYKYVGADKDIPAPDVYTTPEIMGWMLDQYEKNVGHHESGMITGKPLELGGLALRSDSTAKGGFIITKELLHHTPLKREKMKIAIQGFGNAGLHIARMLEGDGFKVVAVSDSKGGVKSTGTRLNIPALIDLKKQGQSVVEYEDHVEKISNEELLELDVDLLVLAALENQITIKNAEKIKAKYILELANGPIDQQADQILFGNKVTVIPDILANAGGVVVSYFEWAQNRTGNILDEDYLEKKLFTIMESSWHRVYELYMDEQTIDLRTAAYMIAIERILKAEKARSNI
jgi:glutamate dehydrogenase/leucine dehydrogenase